MVAAFTSTGRGECIVFSNDNGKTWQEYEKNPVVKHAGRDPRLLWHEPTKKWIMAVYDEHAGSRWIAFYSSPNLKEWTFESRIDGFFECPDLFELPVADEPNKRMWVLYAADGKYMLGDFDGKKFTPRAGKHQLWHGNFYAAQTFSNVPDGRRIQIGWGQEITFPGMPFNQQMTIPCELTLRKTTLGIQMFAEPVKEIESLRSKSKSWKELTLNNKEETLIKDAADLLDIRSEWELDVNQAPAPFGLVIHGRSVIYDDWQKELSCLNLKARLGLERLRVKIRVLVDRGSFQVFGNDGRVAISTGVLPDGKDKSIKASSQGPVKLVSLEVSELKSAWER